MGSRITNKTIDIAYHFIAKTAPDYEVYKDMNDVLHVRKRGQQEYAFEIWRKVITMRNRHNLSEMCINIKRVEKSYFNVPVCLFYEMIKNAISINDNIGLNNEIFDISYRCTIKEFLLYIMVNHRALTGRWNSSIYREAGLVDLQVSARDRTLPCAQIDRTVCLTQCPIDVHNGLYLVGKLIDLGWENIRIAEQGSLYLLKEDSSYAASVT